MSLDRFMRIYGALAENSQVLVSIVITAVSYIIDSGSIYPGLALIVAAILSRISGLDILSLGYLAAVMLSIERGSGSLVLVYITGFILSLAISYIALRSPRELRRYKILETLRIVAMILVAVPLSYYSWLAASTLRPWDPFPLGVVIAISLIMMLIVILRGGGDLEKILEPLVRSSESLSRIYVYIARILVIVASAAYAAMRADPVPLLLLIALLMIMMIIRITRTALRRMDMASVDVVLEIPVSVAILIYVWINP